MCCSHCVIVDSRFVASIVYTLLCFVCDNFFSYVVKSEPIDLLNVAFEQQQNSSNVRYIRIFTYLWQSIVTFYCTLDTSAVHAMEILLIGAIFGVVSGPVGRFYIFRLFIYKIIAYFSLIKLFTK